MMMTMKEKKIVKVMIVSFFLINMYMEYDLYSYNKGCSEVWLSENEEDIIDDLKPPQPGSLSTFGEETTQSEIFVRWIVAFVSYLRNIYKISDVVTGKVLLFLSVLFRLLGQFSTLCKSIALVLPGSIYKFYQYTGGAGILFRKYVVCRKCHHLCLINQCCGDENSRKCSFIEFPNHPHFRRRQACGTYLVKSVELVSGKKIFYPFLTYCYLGVEIGLQSLLLHPSFLVHCQTWKSNTSLLNDIYDGQIWKDFVSYDNQPFLSEEFTYGLLLNLDWFQPFKHVQYSVGAIYLSILNLPRQLRYKQEFTLLVGIMPGPKEAKNINSYLEPLVEELFEFWVGKHLNTHGSSLKKLVKCALLGVACDLPAGRKVCGFLSYNARYGCTRCFKAFEGGVGNQDYSGFNRSSWQRRTPDQHRVAASRIRAATTHADVARIESELGYRNTVLLRLPYFNPTRMLTIDVMHNLFLGTGKRVLKDIWIARQIISESQFEVVQSRIDRMVIPTDIGRIPFKIRSGFSSFTADQFKNWINLFSLIALREIIVGEDLEVWRHLVLSCRILSSKCITKDELSVADALLLHFCQHVERLYGRSSITPNMHMHAHIKECIKDYGPPHAFWAFAFERYNGILGDQPNNNRSVEFQLAKRFVAGNNQSLQTLPELYNEQFSPVMQTSRHVVGTLSQFSSLVSSPSSTSIDWTIDGISAELPKQFTKSVFTQIQIDGLRQLYCSLHSISSSVISMSSSFRKYKTVKLHGRQLGGYRSRSSSSSIVLATWNPALFDLSDEDENSLRAARINYFAEHSISIDNSWVTHLLFSASWYKIHPKQQAYGKPISVWECDVFEIPGTYSVLPVQTIKSRTISLEDNLDTGETVLFICPCVDF